MADVLFFDQLQGVLDIGVHKGLPFASAEQKSDCNSGDDRDDHHGHADNHWHLCRDKCILRTS